MAKISKKKAAKLLEILQQGITAQNQGYLREAELCYRNVLTVDPNNADALHLLGLIATQVGQHQEAITLIDQAVRIKPSFHQAQRNLGLVYFELGQYQHALKHFNIALRARENDSELLIYIADCLKGTNRWEEAIETYQKALEQGVPNSSEVYAQIGRIHSGNGNIEAACHAFHQAWAMDHHNADAISALAIADAKKIHPEQVAEIKQLIEKEKLPPNKLRNFSFALGTYYDKNHDYEQAFQFYHSGNELRDLTFNESSISSEVDHIIQEFNEETLKQTYQPPSGLPNPIFVVGLPRSGSTLIEQILSSHSQVFGAGEIDTLGSVIDHHNAIHGVTYPINIKQINESFILAIARDYLTELDKMSSHAANVVDKRPGNVAHIGLIRMAMPHAKIIVCQRDLRDVALSNYFSDFGERQPWSHKLEHIAAYFQHYRRLIEHWKNICGDALIFIKYEKLVQDIDVQVKELLEACDIEWEDACLHFYEKKSVIKTASVSQVRKPIYTSSVGRWKHYAKHLKPLFEHSDIDENPECYWY